MKRQLTFILFMGLFAAFVFSSTFIVGGCGGDGGGGGGVIGGLATGTFIKTPSYADLDNNSFPFNDTYASQIVQQLYLASEINGAGYINKISFRLGADLGAPVDCPNCTVKLGHTSLTDLTTTFADNVEEGRGSQITVIDDATITIPAGSSGDYFDITLVKPFHYNGVDNLVVEISRTSACTGDVFIDIDDMGASNRELNAQPIAATGSLGPYQRLTKFHFVGGDNSPFSVGGLSLQVPFTSDPVAQRVQDLYLSSDIDGSGPITGVGIEVGILTTEQTYTVSVKLGHATVSTLDTDYDANYSGSPKTVANAVTFTIPAGVPVGNYVWIPLTGSFNYNGTDNLILEFVVSSATGDVFYTYHDHGSGDVRLIFGPSDASIIIPTTIAIHHAKFRFNGGTIMVMPNDAGSLSQVLGGWSPGGQLQSLYRNSDLGTAATINSVSVRLRFDSVATTLTNYKLYMGHTTKTAFDILDTYASNMDESALVYSGILDVPAGLKAGDWLTIPLQTSFNYDVTKNLSILFTTDVGSAGDNNVSATLDGIRYPNHTVGRNDNTVDISGNPTWDYDGILNIQIGITK